MTTGVHPAAGLDRAPKADPAGQRSTLGMVVLALLQEAPMHPYRMHELLKQRGKTSVVNVAQRNSVYQTLSRLVRAGLVEVHETSKDEGRPERVVYRPTETGRATLRAWLEEMLSKPAREFPELPAALSFLMLLAPREVERLLAARIAAQRTRLEASEKAGREVMAAGLPALFLLEDAYREAMLRAEIAWLESTVRDLRKGTLTWSKAWNRKIAIEAEKRQAKAAKG